MPSNKCPICAQTKGKRDCLLQDGQLICSLCCAKTRQPDTCTECPHYESAKHHSAIKARNTKQPHFLAVIDPIIEEKVGKGLILLEKGNSEKAKKIIEPLLESHPNNHSVQYAMGCTFALSGDTKNAIPYFQRSVKIFPYSVEAWHNLEVAFRDQMNVIQAIICAQKVVAYGDPSVPQVKDSRLFLLDIKQLAREQNLSFDQFLEAGILFEKGSDLMESEHFEPAIQKFLKVVKIDPHQVPAYGNLGICYAFTGKKNLALEYIDKALAIKPDYAPAMNNRIAIEKLEEGKIPTEPFVSHYF